MRSAARIDHAALAHNATVLKERAAGAALMAVVKADGYGHGMVACARTAVQAGAEWLGVAFLEEALELRAAGLDAPVLAWLFAPGEDLVPAVAAGVDLGAYSPAEVEAAAAAAVVTGLPARLHLKADTGLSRGGATSAEWPRLCEAAAKAQADGTVEVVGLWSHFASSELGPQHATNAAQKRAFVEAVELAGVHGLRPPLRHLANSGALLTDDTARLDLVRVGAALYGLAPVPGRRPEDDGLMPVMSLVSHVALAKRVPRGSGVSYGHRYTTPRDTNLALVPLGYGDGIPRAAGNAVPVQVNGSRHTVCGVVAMDQLVVDMGDDEVAAGDEVVLFGPGGPTVQEWAEALGTIDYEVVTRVGSRVPREHLGPTP